jgi:uncharacterized protein with ParB-like and HNH nuclease domain
MSVIVPNYRSVQQLLQGASFSIDEYQREYKWERKHIEELLEDLVAKFLNSHRAGDATEKVAGYEDYFLGSIIVSRRGTKSYLVDGQQRVSSLTLLLIHLYRQATELELGVAADIAPLIFSNSYGVKKFNLDIPEREPVIRALFEGEAFNPDGYDESIQTMFARYGNIQDRDLAGELGDALPHFIYWLMGNVGLIEIATDNDSYAYAIFETMNDRGKPLSPVDMLKAFLLAPMSDAEKRRQANKEWKQEVYGLTTWGGEQDQDPERDSACIKAWLRAQYAQTIRERRANASDRDWELIGTVFHRWVRDNAKALGLGKDQPNTAFMTEEFRFFAKAYKQIQAASRAYTPGLEPIFYNAHNEFTWQNTVLLAPLCVTDSDETVRKKLVLTATYLDIWIMRRVTNYVRVGYSSTAYAMFLLCRAIRRKPLDELADILRDRLAADDISFEGAPKQNRLGIDDLGLNQFSRRYIYHMLARLTAYTEARSGKPDLFDKYVDRKSKNACDIEHIWANDFDRYTSDFSSLDEFQKARDNIAGLLLLPADVNRSLQDESFETKAPHYAKQNLYAASLTESAYQHEPQFKAFRDKEQLPFRSYDSFGKAEQAERRALVHDLVKQIWSPDRLAKVLT